MNNNKKIFFALLMAAASVHAAKKTDETSPLGCRNVGYHFELKVLKLKPEETGSRQSLYFIFNYLNKPVTLSQLRKEESPQSLYLNHTIHPRQWAILSTNEKRLSYMCTVESPKSRFGNIVNCEDSLKVCEYANVKYGMNNKGSFWLVDSTSGGAVQQVLHYGIIPR